MRPRPLVITAALAVLGTSSCWWRRADPAHWPQPQGESACNPAAERPSPGRPLVPVSRDGASPLPLDGSFAKVSVGPSTELYRVWVWVVSAESRRTVAMFTANRRVFGSYFFQAKAGDVIAIDIARCDGTRWRRVRPTATEAVTVDGSTSWRIAANDLELAIQHGAGIQQQVEDDAVRRFAPVVRLHRDEPYLPANVHWYLSRVRMRHHRSILKCRRLVILPLCSPIALDAQLLDLGEVNPTSLISQRSGGQVSSSGTKKTNFFLEIWGSDALQQETRRGSLENAVVYAHLRRAPGGSPKYDIQYWFFYPFNGSIARFPPLFEPQHEGDWEHITVRVQPDFVTIDSVFFASHKDNQGWRTRDAVSFEGSHPIVYSALNSHASYAVAGKHSRSTLPDDHTMDGGPVWETWKRVAIVGEPDRPTPGNEWLRYNGRWGQLGVMLAGGALVTDGPPGPAMQCWWHNDDTPP